MNPNQNNNRGKGGNKRNVTAIVSVLLWALVLTLLVNVATSRFQQANSVEVLYGQFRDLVMDGVVDSVLMESDRYTFTLKEGYTLQFDDDGNVEAVKADSQTSSAPVSQAFPEVSPEAENARETFEQLCRRLFEDQLTASFLSLHYSLADPAAYGISDYEISFGDFSLDAMEEDFQAQQEILAALRDIDPQLLTEDQALTWEILTDTLETEQTSQDCLLYYQPLAPSIGVQAQLPVLLAEYVF